MKKLLNTFFALIFGLCPLLVCVVFGAAIYQKIPNLEGVTIIGCLAILAIWLGIKIFTISLKKGPFQVITELYSSPDIDEFVKMADKQKKK